MLAGKLYETNVAYIPVGNQQETNASYILAGTCENTRHGVEQLTGD